MYKSVWPVVFVTAFTVLAISVLSMYWLWTDQFEENRLSGIYAFAMSFVYATGLITWVKRLVESVKEILK